MNISPAENAQNHALEKSTNALSSLPKDSTDFAYEFTAPSLKATLKTSADDFRVSEKLKFELSGQGQHLCLFIEKKFLNTQDALNILTRFFKVPPQAIGYFGLKDKVAVTQQWFSIDLATSNLDKAERNESYCEHFQEAFPQLLAQSMKSNGSDEEALNRKPAQMKILEIKRNSKKFKIGQLSGNAFEIVLRNVSELSAEEALSSLSKTAQATLDKKLTHIKAFGFPNYFGEQRFGRDNQNIEALKKNIETDLTKRRALRARVISTLRALAFNRYLSERLIAKNAKTYLEGDVLQFADGNSVFTNRDQDSVEQIQKRLDEGNIVISGPLVGVDQSLALGESLAFEESIVRKFRTYIPVLDRYQVKSARRALFTQAHHLTWHFSGSDLFLNFELGAGSFATSLIRELVVFRNQKVVK